MGYIYKITNKKSGKSYIGQTITPVAERMRKHISNAKHKQKITGIDAAIKKYGIDSFEVETLCECPNDDLDFQEIYYIKKFDTFNNGYNLTAGGQRSGAGSSIGLIPEEVINTYYKLNSIKATAIYYQCSERTISNLLHANNVEIKRPIHNTENLSKGKKFQLGDGSKKVKIIELNKEFNSMIECCQWMIDNNYCRTTSAVLARKSLSRSIHENRKYCGLTIILI